MNKSPAKRNRRILIVDDNLAIHADFKKILCPSSGALSNLEKSEAEIFGETKPSQVMQGFEVDSAYQGQEAYEFVRESKLAGKPYAVVFMDVRMPPGWDGIETTAKIWAVDPDLQIVICTAFSDYSWDQMVEKFGVSDRLVVLKKPFDYVEVVQLAHALAEKWHLLQAARTKLDQLEVMVAQRTQDLQSAHEQLKTEMAEHARTEATLRQSQKMEALGQLAGGIAHDFNNILTVIRGYTQFLGMEIPETPASLEALEEIARAADRAAQLTSQMLMFSRKKRMQLENLELNSFICGMADMLRRLIGETVQLQLRCDNGALDVRADVVMMEVAILNLAVNARDAMPRGGQLSIRTSEVSGEALQNSPFKQRVSGAYACISLSDTGCGIAPEALPHIFEPFFTTKEIGKGSGLGLATVHGIIQQHEGWIEVKSQPACGATFKIFLPLKTSPVKSAGEPAQLASACGGHETILLVEDEPVVRRLARGILQRQGYRVYEAGSAAQALPVWQNHAGEIDLLLTDMVMPGGITGRELAQQLLAQKRDLKVIYSSGYSPDFVAPDFELIDGHNFLPKPYTQDKLALTVRRCMDEPLVKA